MHNDIIEPENDLSETFERRLDKVASGDIQGLFQFTDRDDINSGGETVVRQNLYEFSD